MSSPFASLSHYSSSTVGTRSPVSTNETDHVIASYIVSTATIHQYLTQQGLITPFQPTHNNICASLWETLTQPIPLSESDESVDFWDERKVKEWGTWEELKNEQWTTPAHVVQQMRKWRASLLARGGEVLEEENLMGDKRELSCRRSGNGKRYDADCLLALQRSSSLRDWATSFFSLASNRKRARDQQSLNLSLRRYDDSTRSLKARDLRTTTSCWRSCRLRRSTKLCEYSRSLAVRDAMGG